MDTELGDGGLYQATVGNGAGEVKVNVSLSFRSSSMCGGPCENNGTCRTVTKCHCPLHYGGDYCQEYIGNKYSLVCEVCVCVGVSTSVRCLHK